MSSAKLKLLVRLVAASLVATVLSVQAIPTALADNSRSLGMSVFRDIVVDQVHGRVFVSGGSVVATDLDGTVIGPVPGISAARQMTLSPDGSELVVANGDFLTIVDPTSLTVSDTIPTGVSSCPEALAVASGKVFFTYGDCVGTPGLGAVDLGSRAITTGLSTGGVAPGQAQLVSVPGAPSLIAARLSSANSWDPKTLVLLDTTGGATPSTSVRISKVFTGTDLNDVALTPDGSAVVLATGSPSAGIYSTTDLSLVGSYPGTGVETAVAVRQDGMVATGLSPNNTVDLQFFTAGGVVPVRQVDLGTTSDVTDILVRPRGVAFGAKRAYVVTTNGALRTIIAGPVPSLKLATDKTLYAYGGSATITATLGATDSRLVNVYRTPAGGTRALVASGLADGSGKFVTHVSGLTQNASFDAVFAGDDDHAPATAKTAVKVSAKVTISTASRSMSSYFHKLAHSPAPVVSVAALPIKPTTACVKFVAQIYRSGAWTSFGSIACPTRSATTGRYGVKMYGFPAGARMRFQATYPATSQNDRTVSAWYYVLYV